MRIRHIWTIFYRELMTYFNTVIGYVFMVVFLFLSVGLYMNTFFVANRIEMRSFFENMPLILAVFLPAISMRLWSEDRRGNTLELLLTLPMSVSSLMLGKFLAALAFFAITLLGTISVPILLSSLGTPDFGPIWGAYLGTLLLASYYLAIGIFISGFFQDQIVSFVLSMVICLGLWFTSTDFFAIVLDGSSPTLRLGTLCKEFVGIRFQNLSKGLLPLGDLFYFFLFSSCFLYLNQLYLKYRRPVRQLSFVGIVFLVCSSTIFLNGLISHLSLPKIDLTQQRLFTLSPYSQKILQTLPFPLSIHFYINEKESLPTNMRSLEQSVVDLLQELKLASKRNNQYYLNYFVSHPRIPPRLPQGESSELSPFEQTLAGEKNSLSAEELEEKKQDRQKLQYETRRLQWKGVNPFPKQTVESDTLEVREVYCSLAIFAMDQTEEILHLEHPRMLDHLEYEILNRIQKLMTRPPQIWVYAPREEDTPQNKFLRSQGMAIPPPRDPFRNVIDYLASFSHYQVRRFHLDRPFEGDLLILFQPEKLNARQEYELSRALSSGKPVLIANQSVLYDFRRYYEAYIPIQPSEKDIDHLLENYGLKIDPRMLLDENYFSARLYNDIPGMEQAKEFRIPFPIHLLVSKKNQHPELILMKGLSALPMVFASAFHFDLPKLEQLKLKIEVLCTSSEKSWFYRPRENKLTVQALTSKPSAQDTGGYPLALLATGHFPFLFEGKPRPAFPKRNPDQFENTPDVFFEEPPLEFEKKSGKLLLIGSSAMFAPENPHPTNFQEVLIFLKNGVDYLTLGEDIIQIRTKNTAVQKIDPSMKPSEKIKKKNYTLFFVPCLIILSGIWRFSFRYLQRKYYRTQIQSQKIRKVL